MTNSQEWLIVLVMIPMMALFGVVGILIPSDTQKEMYVFVVTLWGLFLTFWAFKHYRFECNREKRQAKVVPMS